MKNARLKVWHHTYGFFTAGGEDFFVHSSAFKAACLAPTVDEFYDFDMGEHNGSAVAVNIRLAKR